MQAIPETQSAAVVEKLGGKVVFKHDWPVPTPGTIEVLAKVLYTGVCQSNLHTKAGTACGPDDHPITAIKLPNIDGHEGVARIIALSPHISDPSIHIGQLVGIRCASRICWRCEYCLAKKEQHCVGRKATNRLHHEDGSVQEFVALDAGYLTVLPDGVDVRTVGPVLCAGVTAYKYATIFGATVIAIDSTDKEPYVRSIGATHFLDFRSTLDLIATVHALTNNLGADAAIVTAANPAAFTQAAELLRIGGTLCLNGISPGEAYLRTPVATFVIKSLKVVGNLTGSLGSVWLRMSR